MGASQRVYNPAPEARPPPANEAIVAGGVGTKTVRQVPPRRPGLQHPKDAVENTAVVHPCNATRLVGQHRLDGSPFVVGKFIAHHSRLPSLNHTRAAYLNAPSTCRTQPQVRFRGEPDMNRHERLVGLVENDPKRTLHATD
jgi:hypothetical protein